MSSQPEPIRHEAILTDRAASYFGRAGRAFPVRDRIRSNGLLTLTGIELRFEPDEGPPLVIPVEAIKGLGMGRWLEGFGGFAPVLKVTYRENLVFGVQVVHPERWIEAVESVTRGRPLSGVPARPKSHPGFPGDPRRLILATVVLILLISMALPVFFSWIHGTVLRERETTPAPGLRTGTAP